MILIAILFSSLYCFGIWIITSEDMVLYPVRLWADKHLPAWLYKPLFGCPVCYASIHGGPIFLLITGNYIMLVPAMVAIAGINYMIVKLHQ